VSIMNYGIVVECRGFSEKKKKMVIDALNCIGIESDFFGSYFGDVNYIGSVARDGKICRKVQVACRASKPQKAWLTSFNNLMMLANMNFVEDGRRDFKDVLKSDGNKATKSISLTDYAKGLKIHDRALTVDEIKLLGADEIQTTLTERGNNYGSFETGAELMQGLKQVAHSHPNWQSMPPAQRESIDMILHKIGRSINGNHEYRDNWIDIEGYARLVSDLLR
jgi:hypothetical protein